MVGYDGSQCLTNSLPQSQDLRYIHDDKVVWWICPMVGGQAWTYDYWNDLCHLLLGLNESNVVADLCNIAL